MTKYLYDTNEIIRFIYDDVTYFMRKNTLTDIIVIFDLNGSMSVRYVIDWDNL